VGEVYILAHGYEEAETDDEGTSEYHDGGEKIEDILIKACHAVNMDSIYCEAGNPIIDSTSKKYLNARRNFGIPDEEEIFFIYDATVFGSCQKGFAICNSGIYYSGRVRGYWTWNEFKTLNISGGFFGLKMGSEEFSSGTDGKNLMVILEMIQEYLG
jgi:hypothetical protein